MRQLHLSRSIVFPLTLKIVLATVLLSALAFFAVYHTLANESEAAIVRVIDTDIVGLADSYAAEGLSGISRRITDRLALSPEQGEQPLYSLVDAQGHALVGNVAKWPLIDARSSEVARVVIAGQPPALSRATILRGGLKLLVGRSTTNRDARLRAAAQIFSGALVLIALVAVAFGFATAFTLRSRIAQINSVFQAVERGNLAARAPLARSGDEIAQLGGKVNHMLFRVESLMAAQRDVTDHTAHETRTPLTLLDAELRAAIEISNEPAVMRRLDDARARIKQILSLFDALLDIAAAHALHGDTASLKPVNLSQLAQEIVELYTASAEELGVLLQAEIAPEVWMQGDPVQLSRLIINLLDNAFKYASDGKAITLVVAQGPFLSLADRGAGIVTEHHAAVFERFKRLPGNEQNGHGLGLALVKAIAERHGLSVSIEDAAPGARFIVRKMP